MPDPVTDARGAPPVDVEAIRRNVQVAAYPGRHTTYAAFNALLAEIDRLRQAKEALDHAREINAGYQQQVEALQRRLAALTLAVTKYSKHLSNCALNGWGPTCNCGYHETMEALNGRRRHMCIASSSRAAIDANCAVPMRRSRADGCAELCAGRQLDENPSRGS